mmetsp:Transcript_113389/g.156693  ORF Transcript_113389/g.156693 Transcript_113389/m.156693 type:complete len:80 (-) Transcript_113389:44-283(-)
MEQGVGGTCGEAYGLSHGPIGPLPLGSAPFTGLVANSPRSRALAEPLRSEPLPSSPDPYVWSDGVWCGGGMWGHSWWPA